MKHVQESVLYGFPSCVWKTTLLGCCLGQCAHKVHSLYNVGA